MTTATGKPALEFLDATTVAWTPVADTRCQGLSERILARDLATGVATRILRFAPGTDTSANGVLVHDFWEEVYILDGAIHDKTLDETFTSGMYACRPPGMPHGPWESPLGCLTFEVRYRR